MNKVNSRQKGKRGERAAANYLRSLGFESARRTQQYNGEGAIGDIVADELPKVHIEVKFQRDFMELGTSSFDGALAQAAADCPEGKRWVILWKPKHSGRNQWRVTTDVGATYADDDWNRLILERLQNER